MEKTHSAITIFPVGTVINYAGNISDDGADLTALVDAGWLVCDGRSYDIEQYPELFAVIGTDHGGSGNLFNVPNLVNRFSRGVLGDSTTKYDPDADTRLAAAAGGNAGNKVGSFQPAAVMLPKNPFVVSFNDGHIHSLSRTTHQSQDKSVAGGNTDFSTLATISRNTDPGGEHSHEILGFDETTMPVNLTLFFLIKATSINGSGAMPPGAISAYAGNIAFQPAPAWLYCSGEAYDQLSFPELYKVIRDNFGIGEMPDSFRVPDVRGLFLRGSVPLNRNEAVPLAPVSGDGHPIGSLQDCSTKKPQGLQTSYGGSHHHSIGNAPLKNKDHAHRGGGNFMLWDEPAQIWSTLAGQHSHKVINGDRETRPENIYLHYLICQALLKTAAPPVGSILGFGGDTQEVSIRQMLLADGWMACNGMSLLQGEYPELYEVIGTTYGGDSNNFLLPDLRSFFIRGAGTSVNNSGNKISPGIYSRESTTGKPLSPFYTDIAPNHTHTLKVPNRDDAYSTAGVSWTDYNTSAGQTNEAGNHLHTISGGDKETRPLNLSVDYIIRFK